MNNNGIYYLIIDKQEETLRKFVFSECVTNFLTGRDYKDYIVIKSKYGKITLYENYNNLDELEQQLHYDTFDKEYSYSEQRN